MAESTLTGLRVQGGLAPHHLPQAARLYLAGFDRLLRLPLGRGPRAAALLERVIDPSRAIAAVDAGGDLVGMAGLRDHAGGLIGGGPADMIAVYGRPGALWRGALLSAWDRDVRPGTVLLDGLCVAPGMRRQGIASALLAAAIEAARARGAAQLQLDVGAANEAALALYRHHRFHRVGSRRMPLAARIAGVGEVVEMACDLGPDRAT